VLRACAHLVAVVSAACAAAHSLARPQLSHGQLGKQPAGCSRGNHKYGNHPTTGDAACSKERKQGTAQRRPAAAESEQGNLLLMRGTTTISP
jgi:hypothetical protein